MRASVKIRGFADIGRIDEEYKILGKTERSVRNEKAVI